MTQNQTLTALTNPTNNILKILWCVMTASICVYGALVLSGSLPSLASQAPSEIFPILTLIALAIAASSMMLKSFFLSQQRIIGFLQNKFEAANYARNPQTGSIDENQLNKINSLSVDEIKVFRVYKYCFLPYLISWVINETIAIIGLIAALYGASPQTFLSFALGAIVLNILSFPRIDNIIENLKRSPEYTRLI